MRTYMRGFGAVPSAAAVKTAQQEMNAALVAQGFSPIVADGIIGPKTCGAARMTGHPSLASLGCKSFTDPVRAPGGPPIPPPGPNAPPAPFGPVAPAAPAPVESAGMFGLDTKTILIGAGVIGVGIVVVYYMKKKQAA